ncbi:myosin heavy chain [Biomphalaria pfeifferi]|uniref:Myosin heavy chain n=1 Tax=Biomphalaria pfeifferi TaxID=112525 RepID=A0AAD8BX87_BIOPF|nr:myosin heavy chain [Biomphalaria pfeifferi]
MASCGCRNGETEKLLSQHNGFAFDNVHYDPWQRKVKSKQTHKTSLAPQKVTKCAQKINASFIPHTSSHVQEEDKKLQSRERCKTLEAEIINARKSLDMHLKREKELIELNLQIIDAIESIEDKTHADVKQLLRKYEKYRSGIATLNANFLNELAEEKEDLQHRKAFMDSQISGLERKVEELNEQLHEKQNELSILSTYKDKEYPVKAMMISNFQAELDNFKSSNQADQEELEHIIKTELGKYERERIKVSNNIIYKVIVESVALMHPSIKDTALQNVVMKKEIEFHQKHHEEITQVNKQLEREIEYLLKSPKSNLRLQLFPEFFPKREKCTPEMELTFDIPTRDWLPI